MRCGLINLVDESFNVEGGLIECGELLIFGGGEGADAVEKIFFEKIAHAEPGAVGFVGVGGSDTAFGGADFAGVGAGALFGAVECLVVGEYEVSAVGDEESVGEGNVAVGELCEFFAETDEVDHETVADDAFAGFAEDAGGGEVKYKFLVFDFYGVSGVVAALVTNYPVGVVGEYIDYFSFAFVAPLRAEEYRIGHSFFLWFGACVGFVCQRTNDEN